MAISTVPAPDESEVRSHPEMLSPFVRVTAVCSLLGAEVIHAAVIQEHIQEWLPLGIFFLVISLVEGFLAVALITRPSRRLVRPIIVVSLGTVVLWLYTRTLGLPIGPMAGRVEEFGRLDVVCSILELVTVAVLLVRPGQRLWTRTKR
jgi:hypothetical protein